MQTARMTHANAKFDELQNTVQSLLEELATLRSVVHKLDEELAELRDRVPPLYTGSLNPPPAIELDAGQAAALLGVSRRYYVDELSKRQGFPKPSTNLSQKTRRWRYADLLKVKMRLPKNG
jgi:hypothetical protein